MQLAMIAAIIRADQHVDDVFRRRTARQKIEAAHAIERIDQRLRRQRTDTASRVWTQRADGEEPARDRHAQRAARIAGNDRPGHASPRRTPPRPLPDLRAQNRPI
jgi:hypothetical protein